MIPNAAGLENVLQPLDDLALERVTGGMDLSDQEESINIEDCRTDMCFSELTGWMDYPNTGGGSCYADHPPPAPPGNTP